MAAHVLTVRQGGRHGTASVTIGSTEATGETNGGCHWGGFLLFGSGKARSGPVPVHGKTLSILDCADHRVNLRALAGPLDWGAYKRYRR